MKSFIQLHIYYAKKKKKSVFAEFELNFHF